MPELFESRVNLPNRLYSIWVNIVYIIYAISTLYIRYIFVIEFRNKGIELWTKRQLVCFSAPINNQIIDTPPCSRQVQNDSQ